MRQIIALLSVLLLSACATNMRSEVASFYETVPQTGQSFKVVALDEKKQGGIEFGKYAALLADELSRQGYQYTPDAENPDLVVRFDYDVSNGEDRLKVIPDSHAGLRYGWGIGMRWGYYDPFGMSFFGRHNDVLPVTVYTRKLAISITKDDVVVYESRLANTNRSNDLTKAMPLLVKSLFVDFPGESEKLRRVTIPKN